MSMMKERRMEIVFRGGRNVRFYFPIQTTDESMAARIEEVLKLPTVCVSAGDVFYVMPTSAIEMISISPAPRKLPRTVIRGARARFAGRESTNRKR